MLEIGVHVVTVDYNRTTILVHHLTDDVTGVRRPICGTEIDKLFNEGDPNYLLEKIRCGTTPLFDDASSQMCGRCSRIYLSPGSDELKSERRLTRWKRKKTRDETVETYKELIFTRWLNKCPKCQSTISIQEPSGYNTAEADCSICKVRWSFIVSAKANGRFVIWVEDTGDEYSGKTEGHIEIEQIDWNWS